MGWCCVISQHWTRKYLAFFARRWKVWESGRQPPRTGTPVVDSIRRPSKGLAAQPFTKVLDPLAIGGREPTSSGKHPACEEV